MLNSSQLTASGVSILKGDWTLWFLGRAQAWAVHVCGLVQADLPFLKEAMAAKNPAIQRASVLPSFEHIALLVSQAPDLSLAGAIEAFAER